MSGTIRCPGWACWHAQQMLGGWAWRNPGGWATPSCSVSGIASKSVSGRSTASWKSRGNAFTVEEWRLKSSSTGRLDLFRLFLTLYIAELIIRSCPKLNLMITFMWFRIYHAPILFSLFWSCKRRSEALQYSRAIHQIKRSVLILLLNKPKCCLIHPYRTVLLIAPDRV